MPGPAEDPRTAAYAAELSALGAATLGESGGRPMGPRVQPAWRGARLAAPAYPVRCTPGDNLAVHVAVTRGPGRQRARGRRRRRGRARLLGRGADYRGRGPGPRRAGHRRWRPGHRRPRGPRVPCLLLHRRPARRHQAAARDGGLARDVGGVAVARGTGWWATATAWWSSPAAALDEVLAAGRARAEKEDGMFAAAAPRVHRPSSSWGSTRRRWRAPEVVPPGADGAQAVTRLGGVRPASTSHTPWQASRAIRVRVWRGGAADVGQQHGAGGAEQPRVAPSARPRRRRGRRRRSSPPRGRRPAPPRRPPAPGPC